MFLNEEQIDRNIGWLLEHASPPVLYLTHKYILKTDPDSPEMAGLWRQVETCRPVRDIFSKQNPDGSWCAGGAWATKPSYSPQEGYEPTTPKYVTTAWILPLLADMGFDRHDQRIRRACNYMLTFQWPEGFFAGARTLSLRDQADKKSHLPVIPCHFAVYLSAFAKAGMGADPQLKKSFDLLARWQQPDGGWLDERHKTGAIAPYVVWDRSCPWSTYHAASALFHSGDPDYREATRRALRFLVGHLAAKGEDDIKHFYYHGHNTVRELVILAETGLGIDERPVQVLLEWLMTMYHPDEGRFGYTGKPVSQYSTGIDGVSPRVMKYRLYHLIEDDWLTYYLTRIAKNLTNYG